MIKMTNPHNRKTGLAIIFQKKFELKLFIFYTPVDLILSIIASAGLSVDRYAPQLGVVRL